MSLDTETAKVQRREPEKADTVRVKVKADLSDPDRTQAIPGTHMTQATVNLPRDLVRANDGGRMPSRGITNAPTGQQVLVFRATTSQRRVTPGMIALGAAGALCIGVLVALVMLLNRPDELPMQPSQVDVGAAASEDDEQVKRVELTLEKPVDRGKSVELSWESSVPLEYAVIVAAKDEQARAILAKDATTMSIEIDPKREYCFQVQGSDSNGVTYESEPLPIRGATCTQ